MLMVHFQWRSRTRSFRWFQPLLGIAHLKNGIARLLALRITNFLFTQILTQLLYIRWACVVLRGWLLYIGCSICCTARPQSEFGR